MAMRRSLLFPALVVCLAFVKGCGGQSSGDPISPSDDIPFHSHVVCLSRPEGQGVACEPSELLRAFNTWAAEAMTRPLSTFTVWAAGPTREYRRFFVACVPPTWRGNVWNAKRAFLESGRQGAMGSQMGVRVPEGCVPPEPRAPGFHRLEVAASVLPVGREVLEKIGSQPSATAIHTAVLCDRSSSTLGAACTTGGLLHAFDQWLAESLAAPASSLAIYEVGDSHKAAKPLYQLVVPDRSVGERVAALSGARTELMGILANPAAGSASPVAEGISEVVSMLRQRHGRYRLTVKSDLLQRTQGVWNFERTVPATARFVAWLRKEGLIADLRDIPVTVCGVHHRPLPNGQGATTRTRAVQVKAVWTDAFRAMGAGDVTMRARCDDPFATLTTKEDPS
jgi:hypothetical protein